MIVPIYHPHTVYVCCRTSKRIRIRTRHNTHTLAIRMFVFKNWYCAMTFKSRSLCLVSSSFKTSGSAERSGSWIFYCESAGCGSTSRRRRRTLSWTGGRSTTTTTNVIWVSRSDTPCISSKGLRRRFDATCHSSTDCRGSVWCKRYSLYKFKRIVLMKLYFFNRVQCVSTTQYVILWQIQGGHNPKVCSVQADRHNLNFYYKFWWVSIYSTNVRIRVVQPICIYLQQIWNKMECRFSK